VILRAVLHCGFTGEFHSALFVHSNAFNPDFVAFFNNIFYLFDTEVCQFADMAQAFLAWKHCHKATEVLH
jgi:hypothetical protein